MTLHTLGTLHYVLHSMLQLLHFTLHTMHLTPHSPHSTLYTVHSTIYTLHFTLCTVYAPHSTLYNAHSTLYSFTLCTLHFALHLHNLTLFTLDPVWNLGQISFSCCARTPTSCPPLRLCTRYFFPRCQRPTPMRKVDL